MVLGQKHGPALDAPRPYRVTETRDENGLTLTYRWFTFDYIFLVFFCAFWDWGLFTWYSSVLSLGATATDVRFWMPIFHVAVGVWAHYVTFAGLLNRTRIVVAGGEITVRHWPVPWLGNQRLTRADFRQIYREQTVSIMGRGPRTPSYHVSVVTADNFKMRLVSDVPGADLALYLEQAIENELGLQDRKVRGEMPK